MSTPAQKNLEDKNAEYAKTFTQGDLPVQPTQHYLILTCMDARVDPAAAFGLPLGAAHVVRNLGASARDALRSVVASQQLLGTREVLVVKHTDCGATHCPADEREVHASVRGKLGDGAARAIAHVDFEPFRDAEGAARGDVEFLRGCEAVEEGVVVSGWVLDVGTGRARRVV